MANDKLMTYEQGSDMITELNTIAANISQINKNIDLGANKVTSMAGYTLQSDASNITTSDTLNQAVSKLEKRVEDNKNSITDIKDGTSINSFGNVETALAQKQDALNSEQLDAVNSGITTADVTQIETNKNNISLQQDTIADGGNGYALVNGIRVYVSSTAPAGDIPDGSVGVGW